MNTIRSAVDPVTLAIVRNGHQGHRAAHHASHDPLGQLVHRQGNGTAPHVYLRCAGTTARRGGGPAIQLNTVGVCLKDILAHYFPLESWKPGDVIITNDHMPETARSRPPTPTTTLAFHRCFMKAMSPFPDDGASLDIGGMNMGTRGWGTEIYQEGLRIPPLKIIEEAQLDGKVLDIIRPTRARARCSRTTSCRQISSVKVAATTAAALPQVRQRQMKACFREPRYSATEHAASARVDPRWLYRHEEPIRDDGAKGGPTGFGGRSRNRGTA